MRDAWRSRGGREGGEEEARKEEMGGDGKIK